MIYYVCMRYAQYVQVQRLRVFDPLFFTTVVLEHKYNKMIQPRPVVMIQPICHKNHWTLAVVVTSGTTSTLYYFDSLAKKKSKLAEEYADFLHTADATTTVDVRKIKVTIQKNDYDCGVHVLSHAERIILKMIKTQDNELCGMIERMKFNVIKTRNEIKTDILSSVSECLSNQKCWGKYHAQGDGSHVLESFWWPCLRISEELGKKIDKKTHTDTFSPVVWYMASIDDTLWIHKSDLRPLESMTLEEVLASCRYTAEEVAEVTAAYEEAK